METHLTSWQERSNRDLAESPRFNFLFISSQLAVYSDSGVVSNNHATSAMAPLLASAPHWQPEHSRSRPCRDTPGGQAASSRKLTDAAVAALLR